jgi:antitoxin HicB
LHTQPNSRRTKAEASWFVFGISRRLSLAAAICQTPSNKGADCLQEALAGRLVRRDDIPKPSKERRGERRIPVAMYLAPKLALFRAMERSEVNNSELARRLGVTESVVRRMLSPKHETKAGKIEAALRALGKEAVVHVSDAA